MEDQLGKLAAGVIGVCLVAMVFIIIGLFMDEFGVFTYLECGNWYQCPDKWAKPYPD